MLHKYPDTYTDTHTHVYIHVSIHIHKLKYFKAQAHWKPVNTKISSPVLALVQSETMVLVLSAVLLAVEAMHSAGQ